MSDWSSQDAVPTRYSVAAAGGVIASQGLHVGRAASVAVDEATGAEPAEGVAHEEQRSGDADDVDARLRERALERLVGASRQHDLGIHGRQLSLKLARRRRARMRGRREVYASRQRG